MVNPKLAVALTGRSGEALEEYKKLMLKLNNEVVAAAPEDLLINTHVCRGNYHSTFFSSGAYDSVADLLLVRKMLMLIILNMMMSVQADLHH